MKKKTLSALTGLVVAALALTGCSADTAIPEGVEDKGTVTVGFQKGNTLNILKARGNLDERLAEEGYTIEWEEFAIGTALLEALNTDNIDFGHASDANSVFSAAG